MLCTKTSNEKNRLPEQRINIFVQTELRLAGPRPCNTASSGKREEENRITMMTLRYGAPWCNILNRANWHRVPVLPGGCGSALARPAIDSTSPQCAVQFGWALMMIECIFACRENKLRWISSVSAWSLTPSLLLGHLVTPGFRCRNDCYWVA